jgi:hypothetical protein
MLRAKGWIGIRMPGSQRDAGFALLRRGRVVLGGPGENYKPEDVFGQGNTFRSQRLVGEIHLDDWPVTQAKDAFDWSGGLEEAFVAELKYVCRDYMEKAETHRERRPSRAVSTADMERASSSMRQILSDRRFGDALAQEIILKPVERTQVQEASDTAKLHAVSEGPVVYRVHVGGADWEFRLHWQDKLSDAHWMSITCPQETITEIFLNVAHPFFVPLIDDRLALELVQKFVIAMALAERMARQIYRDDRIAPADLRNLMNKVLLNASQLEAERGA